MKLTKNTISKDLNKKIDDLEDLPEDAYQYWRKITPKRTGNARRRTSRKKNTIRAKYDYATYLDQGSSKKAPQGMSKPTEKFLNKMLRKIMRK